MNRRRSSHLEGAVQRAREALTHVSVGARTVDIFHAIQFAVPIRAGFLDAFGPSKLAGGSLSPFSLPEGLLEAIMRGRPEDAPPVLGVVARAPAGAVLTERTTLSADRWRRIQGYIALDRFGLGQALCIKLRCPGAGHGSHQYAAMLCERGDPPLQPEEISALEALAPDVIAAVDRARLPLVPHNPILEQILTESDIGFVAVTESGAILEANPRAFTLAGRYAKKLGAMRPGEGVRLLVGRVSPDRTTRVTPLVLPHPEERSALRIRAHDLKKEVHLLAEDTVLLVLDEIFGASEDAAGAALAALPPRRRQIAQALVTTGWSVKEIARELGLSPSTVRNHIDILYDQLEVHSRAELVQRLRDRPR